MKKIRLGRSGLMVTKTSLGCLPIQRRDTAEAVRILRRAYEAGINYYDTANAYTDSEEKIGLALGDVRGDIIISTKSHSTEYDVVMRHIEQSLKSMKTDYIDLFQFHNINALPDPGDPKGAYAAAEEMKRNGHVRHIGVTTHKIDAAFEAVGSGLFETMQFPFSHISAERDFELVRLCEEKDVGFIAMKGLAGGLLTNPRLCCAFMKQWPVVPIWGVQTMEELEQWIALDAEDPELDGGLRAEMERDRAALAGSFCRGCGYCLPCPAGIEIHSAARMALLLRRMPCEQFLTDAEREKMHRIEDCTGCGACRPRCPYGLDTPEILKAMLKDYDEFYEEYNK